MFYDLKFLLLYVAALLSKIRNYYGYTAFVFGSVEELRGNIIIGTTALDFAISLF